MSRKRSLGLSFIPVAKNFSEMEDWQVEEALGKEENPTIYLEKLVLSLLNELDTNQERVILLFQLLRSQGFELDHKSCANSIGVNLRWYMRKKAQVVKKLRKFNVIDWPYKG